MALRHKLSLCMLATLAVPAVAMQEAPPGEAPPSEVVAEVWTARRVDADLSHVDFAAAYWSAAPAQEILLQAQPMVTPRPALVQTAALAVRAVHDGTWLAMQLRWADTEKSEAGRLGEFSDAAAVQFPMLAAAEPPPVFMGVKGNPVHIFHWRAQYQRDHESGKPTIKDLYPNTNIDMYPMEFADRGQLAEGAAIEGEQFSPGRAIGNPQSFAKSGVDEIWAEGFSTSSVQESVAFGEGRWLDGHWTLILVRPLAREGGSSFTPGSQTFTAFAVWQGGQDEVGSRKSVTMIWTPLRFEGPTQTAAVR
jgi:Ethylbenzene dehydrogenase